MRRFLLGIGSFFPAAAVFGVIGMIAVATVRGGGDPDYGGGHDEPPDWLIWLALFAMIVLLLVLIVCLRDAFNNPRIPDEKRTLWVIVLLLGSTLAVPVYWWVYVRPGTPNSELGRIERRPDLEP